jgi:hypothetical protein
MGGLIITAVRRMRPNRVADLNELLCEPLRGGMPLGLANDINERGEVAVDAHDPLFSATRAILLTPVLGPEGCEP